MIDERQLAGMMAELRSRGDLPALDANVATICSLTEDPLTGAADLTSVILRDAALTASVVSTANSALYSPSEPVKTVSTAILLLGFEKVRALALGLSILKQMEQNAQNRNLYRLFACAYFSGMFAMALGRRLGHPNPEELLVAGVLTQLPRLLLAHAFPDRYAAMEERMSKDKLSLERACEETFGINYLGLTDEISRHWNMPASVGRALKGHGDSPTSLLRQASRVADMMFGNLSGSAASLEASERDLQTALKNPEFRLTEFIGQTCEADPNVTRFFRLNRNDVEMMVKIVEWGRVNPAEVAAALTSGTNLTQPAEKPVEDATVLIGHYLTELMVSVRKGADINRILLTGLEAIYRCVRPTCALLMFLDGSKQNLQGRFYLGPIVLRPGEIQLSIQDSGGPVSRCMSMKQPVHLTEADALQIRVFGPTVLATALLIPVVVLGNAVGLCVVGRDQARPFSEDEQMWAEAVMGHIAVAFERNRGTR